MKNSLKNNSLSRNANKVQKPPNQADRLPVDITMLSFMTPTARTMTLFDFRFFLYSDQSEFVDLTGVGESNFILSAF